MVDYIKPLGMPSACKFEEMDAYFTKLRRMLSDATAIPEHIMDTEIHVSYKAMNWLMAQDLPLPRERLGR
jgi:hypothetical protein